MRIITIKYRQGISATLKDLLLLFAGFVFWGEIFLTTTSFPDPSYLLPK